MRIGINARLLRDSTMRGWNRYTVNLVAELSRLGVELVLYSDRPVHAAHLARFASDSCKVVQSFPMRYLFWEQLWLPRQCARDRVDVLHSPYNYSIPWSSSCPRVLTLHDAIDAVYYRPQTSWTDNLSIGSLKTRLRNWAAIARADRIITVSNHGRRDLVEALGIPAAKISVIYEAAEPRFGQRVPDDARERVRRKYELPARYVLYVGGWERRKNLPFLMREFAAAKLNDVGLVLGGGREDERAPLMQLAHELDVGARTTLLGWIDDEDLPAIYSGAMCFAYPSEYEGFGLQLCEAMAAGCPTLAAHATSLPEVLGDGGETFALDSPGSLAGLLRRVSTDHDFRMDLAGRARARSREFSWGETARQTLSVYESLLRAANSQPMATTSDQPACER
ncbi:MAG: glycosyltransferase family 4 protein [Candidatus Binatus sp.]